eukprot:scpid98714/ scgid26264/ 
MVRRWKQKEASLKGIEKSTTCRGRARARLVGGGNTLLLCDLEDELFGWIVAERQQCRRVTRKSVQAMAKRIHDEQGGQEPFNVSAGRCGHFMEHLQLMTRVKTHQSHRTPADLIPKLTDFLVFFRKLFADNNDLNPANIFAMDETAVWFDATSNRTVNEIGARTISM